MPVYNLNFKTIGMYDCIDKEYAIDLFSDILCDIFNKTFSGKEIFNVEYLIRQNFLTIIETESIMRYLFGKPYFVYTDSFGEHGLSRLEAEVIEQVCKKNGYKEITIRKIIKQQSYGRNT